MNPVALLYAVESEILADIARLLKGGHIDSADWKIEKMRKLAVLNDRAADKLRRYRDAVQDGTATAVDEAAMQALLAGEDTFKKAKDAGATLKDALPLEADPTIKATIEAWQSTAKTQINLTMATMLERSSQVYVDTLNRVTAQVLSGAMSGREALVRAVKEWSQRGLPSIIDKAGRQWTTEAYANMVIRTNTRRVITEVQMERALEYGADLIEVSAHSGARPLCEPYQGRIFSLSGKSEKYPPFSTTSYGEPAGLFGINCGHIQYPFFEGISNQTYSPTDDKEENDRIFQESQTQRAFERSIRAAKRELDVVEALGDQKSTYEARRTLQERQAALREFLQETGRTRQRSREQVYDRIRPETRITSARPPVAPLSPAPVLEPLSAVAGKFVPAATVEEAKLWAGANLGIKQNTSKLNLEALNAIHEELFTLKQEWESKVSYIGERDSPYASANHLIMNFCSRYFNDQEKLQRNYDSDIESSFHPAGGTALKAIVDHEFAHTMTVLDISSAYGSHPEFRSAIIRLKSAYTRSVNKGGEIISRYAAKDTHEFVAESFTMALNNSKPHPIATQVFELMKKTYRRNKL